MALPSPHPPSRRPFLAILVGISLFAFGVFFGHYTPMLSSRSGSFVDALNRFTTANPNIDVTVLHKTWDAIQEKYVSRPVTSEQLLHGALEGMVRSLDDPYSFYIKPGEAAAFEDEINGKFEGIGAELGLKDKKIVVIAPLANTPAERSGIRAGDTIISIDGVQTEAMTLEQAVSRIRGKAGTKVELEIARQDNMPRKISLTRARIQVKSVKMEFRDVQGGAVSIIKISSFTQSTVQEFNQALRTMLLQKPRGIILDVRNNPGGYLSAALAVADTFLSDGTIVIEDFGHGTQEKTDADPSAPLASIPVVVVINEGTASAAEILAGALQDRLHAVVIGKKSFGKGSVQEITDLSDGSTLKLTVARWLTPNGRSIDGTGIEPSEPIDLSQDDEAHDRDPQLDRALELVVPQL